MRLFLSLIISMTISPAFAHEFWIEPENYQVKSGEPVIANLRNGENFSGGPLSWIDRRIARSEAWVGQDVKKLSGRAGDLPAISFQPRNAGLLRLVHETTLSTLPYKSADKFQAFVDHKDLDTSALPDPTYPFSEGYRRFAKALIGIAGAEGQDQVSGMETEFVALENPYTYGIADQLPVRLYYQNNPRPDAQIEIFERAPDGSVQVFLLRTDGNGEALIPVQPGHAYLLDAVILRRPASALAKERGVLWESLWAALTFAIPVAVKD